MKSSWLRISLIAVAALVIVYYLGPRPATPRYDPILPSVPQQPLQLEAYISAKEHSHKLKPDNQARIIWNDSLRRKTPYSVVYLHGFSASQEEGDPVHQDFAKKYGCNLYLSRLDAHGLDTSEPLLTMTATGLWEDAKEALSIGKAIGEKVILITCSTGGTLGLKLAATYPNDVYAVINMSPNVAINDDMAFLANNPWGLQIARLIFKGNYRQSVPENPEIAKFWYSRYRLEAVVELENLLESTMDPGLFHTIRQPVLNLYYFRDADHQDKTVKVSAILQMHEQLGTPADKKEAVAIPQAEAHVIGSYLTSHDVPAVERAIDSFVQNKLGLQPVK
ncbi:alpha/beta hydrolase [Chitinophaga rhizophila]|uniref:Alpha/beta hydrolase n=1 Tax=Chitinophaga rhizophila TaxID=2866212 RepID=A0ABS7GJ20_9BACT|nr:alpha/beta hydrolase [Chitinophaga rhizophila]MBW8687700.1 alpha/beta hydrolase [Chitinophaga rhizophila]